MAGPDLPGPVPVVSPTVGVSGARRLLVIWNARAGSAEGSEQQALVRRELTARGVEAEIFESTSEAAAEARIAAALGERFDAIVAAGGDGTVRSVALQLAGTDVPLGILPLGTAMNIANGLGLPLELDEALAVLAAGRPHPIDLAEADGRPFLEVASVGLAADVLAEATRVKTGRWQAALDLVRRARRYPRTRITLDLDGRIVRTRGLSLVVANSAYTGRGLQVAPGARMDDGLLDVVVFRGFGPYRLGLHLIGTLLGRRSDPRIRTYRARRIRIESRRPLPVRADSCDQGMTPIGLTVRGSALRVIVTG